MTRRTWRVAVFPGAANAPLQFARDQGWLEEAGLDVDVTEVRSSQEQVALWEAGSCDVMHTSPDHLLRRRLERHPVIVRRNGLGELSVFRRPEEEDLTRIAWAVDDEASAFAFVLRALLEDACGVPQADQRIVPVGGTNVRLEALLAEDRAIGGTTLHPPFDAIAARAGCVRLAGHHETLPELMTLVTVVPRDQVSDPDVRSYLDILDKAADALIDGGEAVVAEVLTRLGLPADTAGMAAAGMLGPGGLSTDRTPALEGLRAVADLRARFTSDWSPPQPLGDLLAG